MGNSDSRRKLWAARENAGLCIYCGKNPQTGNKGCKKCLRKKAKASCRFAKNHPHRQKEYRRKIRFEVLKKYGGQCKCCGESRLEFLAIDHVKKNGAQERKSLYGTNFGASHRWFLKLKREEIRIDLQVLCHNCNIASFQFGECPHEFREKGSAKNV